MILRLEQYSQNYSHACKMCFDPNNDFFLWRETEKNMAKKRRVKSN